MGISCAGWFTYFYLGYLIGNDLIRIRLSDRKLLITMGGCIALQVLEGYWYLYMGEANCGTQLKLSAIMTGALFVILSYRFIILNIDVNNKLLYLVGNCSFGIFFSHILIMKVLRLIPGYSTYAIYPFNAIITSVVSLLFVLSGRRMLGRFGKYLALG